MAAWNVPFLVISNLARPGVYDHGSLLRSPEHGFAMHQCPGAAGAAHPIAEFW